MIGVKKIAADVVNLTNNIVEKVDEVNDKFLISICLFLAVGVIILAVVLSCPTYFQKITILFTLAFCIAGLFSGLSRKWSYGKLNVRGLVVIGIFLFVFSVGFIPVVQGSVCNSPVVEGNIYLGQKPLQGATISLPHHDFKTITNRLGQFSIQLNAKNLNSDSFLIVIRVNGVDTALYWKNIKTPIVLHLKDTLVPISKPLVQRLIYEQIELFEKKMQGNYLKWQRKSVVSLADLLDKFSPFAVAQNRYRNEFIFESLYRQISFRKNLIAAGINEVEKIIAPYKKHEFENCVIYELSHSNFPNYQLDYVMTNSEPIEFSIANLQHIRDDHYKVKVVFKENVRDVRVNLNCSEQTNNYKIRQMELYGFLPIEEYELKFKYGKWSII